MKRYLKRIISLFIIGIANFSMLFTNRFKPSHTRNWLFRRIGMKIGSNVLIDKNFSFYDPTTISIGNYVLIRENCYFDHHITVGNFCTFSRDVMILTAGHNPHDLSYRMSPVVIEDFVWIGAKVLILPGVHIGTNSVVAAGAIVSKDVLPYTLVGGNPAKFIKKIDKPIIYHHQFKEVMFQNSHSNI